LQLVSHWLGLYGQGLFPVAAPILAKKKPGNQKVAGPETNFTALTTLQNNLFDLFVGQQG